MKVDNTLKDDIAETLYIPLFMRSKCTKMKNAIISDPLAVSLVDQINYPFDQFNKSKLSLIGTALRVRHFDEKVSDFIANHDHPVVLIIGCGLDTRYQRIGQISQKAVFYYIDLKEVLVLREALLPHQSNEFLITASMLERGWMSEIKDAQPVDASFIFVIEGVLMYFSEDDVKTVLCALADVFHAGDIHFDVCSRWLAKNSKKHDVIKLMKATFKWGIDDEASMAKWHPLLKYQKTYYYTDFPEWKRVGLLASIISFIPRFKKAGKILSYKIV